MRLNRNDLRKIMYDFNSLSNRLIQADFRDYDGVLVKFINYLSGTEIISDYISDCGECDQVMAQEFKEVQTGHAIFTLGESDEEEVRNVFAILKYITNNKIDVCYGIGMAYSSSNKFADILKAFNERVTMVLIRHIEAYLTKVGIDMGLDDKITYNITVKDGQVNIANDNATINATNTVNGNDLQQISDMIAKIRDEASNCALSSEDIDTLHNSLEVVEEEVKLEKPRKSFINTAFSAIKAIKGTAEFTAAIAALIQFVQPLLR